VRGLKKPLQGRRGLTAPQVLRSLVLMRVKNWDYRELRERIADGLTLRQFTDFYCDRVPKHDAFNRGFNRLTLRRSKPSMIWWFKPRSRLVWKTAPSCESTHGGRDRIHHPTDNTLLWDVVRVVTRLVAALPRRWRCRCIKGFRDAGVQRTVACTRFNG